MDTCTSPGGFTEINDVFGCGKYGIEVPTGRCLPYNRAIDAHTFAGFSACSSYSEKHTLVHDGDHGGGHTNPNLSFIALSFNDMLA